LNDNLRKGSLFYEVMHNRTQINHSHYLISMPTSTLGLSGRSGCACVSGFCLRHFRLVWCCLVWVFIFSYVPVSALEYLRFAYQGRNRSEEGRIVLEDPDGLLFEARDGQIYVIEWKNVMTRRHDDLPFEPYTKAEMIERLKKEFPPSDGYYYLDMYGPFIVVYTTERAFANWYGRLLEKLHGRYVERWKRREVELTKPEFPMVAIVLASKEQYQQHAKHDGVTLFSEQCAYYHKWTNRITMYDMSGAQVRQAGNRRQATAADIQWFLKQPGSYNNIASVIHEGVHQIGFNTGMHPRSTRSPMWFYEGLAVFHEVPDRNNSDIGWTPGPHINIPRLTQLKQYWGKPQSEPPIQKMIREDSLFRQQNTALDNYALAWGLIYYLDKRRPKELAAYMQTLQEKTLDSKDSGEIRIKDFESCFGDDWEKFYKEFSDFLKRL